MGLALRVLVGFRVEGGKPVRFSLLFLTLIFFPVVVTSVGCLAKVLANPLAAHIMLFNSSEVREEALADTFFFDFVVTFVLG